MDKRFILSCIGITLLGVSCSYHHEYTDEVFRAETPGKNGKAPDYYYFGSDNDYDYFKISDFKYKIAKTSESVSFDAQTPFEGFFGKSGVLTKLNLKPGQTVKLIPAQ